MEASGCRDVAGEGRGSASPYTFRRRRAGPSSILILLCAFYELQEENRGVERRIEALSVGSDTISGQDSS